MTDTGELIGTAIGAGIAGAIGFKVLSMIENEGKETHKKSKGKPKDIFDLDMDFDF